MENWKKKYCNVAKAPLDIFLIMNHMLKNTMLHNIFYEINISDIKHCNKQYLCPVLSYSRSLFFAWLEPSFMALHAHFFAEELF